MEFIHPDIQAYAEEHTSAESNLLQQINRDTHAQVLRPRMLSGHLQGRWLAMVSQMVRPLHVLEIGTYTGYSALCLAEGLLPEGRLITLDINEELEDKVRGYFNASDHAEQIDYRIGDARKIIPQLAETFDLVFIDADKESYGLYYDLVIEKLRPGGFILVDNVLWSGKVVEGKNDKDTRNMIEFNRKIQDDHRIENVLLPIRDGIMMIRKVSL
ncbi:MAG TPA: class I SAM-dependent methyltransferase [Ohtaekwangia sp.]|nr:class I SAM-dependent methyltransferase [Ohtaekwangia sp.]